MAVVEEVTADLEAEVGLVEVAEADLAGGTSAGVGEEGTPGVVGVVKIDLEGVAGVNLEAVEEITTAEVLIGSISRFESRKSLIFWKKNFNQESLEILHNFFKNH